MASGNTPSRGESLSGYFPAFGPRSGAKVFSANVKAAFLSGTIVSGKITIAIAHGLGSKPKLVIVTPIHTLTQAISATSNSLSLASASAATTTNFYVIGNQKANVAMKYAAFVML